MRLARFSPLLLTFSIIFLAPFCYAGTYYANSCSYADVNDCINGSGAKTCHAGSQTGSQATHTAVDGDTINIPSGSCSWSTGIVVPSKAGITIIGSGTPNSGSSTTGAASSCTATTITVTGGFTLFNMTPQYGNSTSRISCMQITYSSGAATFASIAGTCTSSGCPNLREDNLTFTNWSNHTEAGNSYGIEAVGDMFGVIDHNTISGTGGYLQLMEESNAAYLGVQQYGDNSWTNPENFGTANFLFLENNIFNESGTMDNEGGTGGLETRGGGRVVVRYNTFVPDLYDAAVSWHGTESNDRARGGRAWEFYGNTINFSVYGQAQVGMRSGTGLTWGNTVTFTAGAGEASFENLDTYRTAGSPSPEWGPCDGSSVYDTNDGTTYYSGTISSFTGSDPYTITVSGSPGWTTNQWFQNGAPYSIHDVTQDSGMEIASNGSATLTTVSGGGPGSYVPVNGDSIQILRATVCIDEAGGRGAGFLYTGSNGSSQATPQQPADEVQSPTYEWMDSFSGATPSYVIYSDTARVIANRDFYEENVNQAAQTSVTSPFNGSSGTGHGTIARRPTSCTTGVGYWATDQGSWDSVSGGAQGELFVCTAPNTWTLDYTPYCYPHPLTAGGTISGGTSGTNASGLGTPMCLTATF